MKVNRSRQIESDLLRQSQLAPFSAPKRTSQTQFIDFLNRPDVAARNALFVKYASPNRAAEELLPEEFLQDPGIYPSEEVLQRCEFYGTLPARVLKSFNASMIRLLH